ncbi:hypothetical protein [Thiomonas sp.]
MTIVFRTSSFFLVIVLTTKMVAVFSEAITVPDDSATHAFVERVEKLVDEAVKTHGEAREAAEQIETMSFALRLFGDRSIECLRAMAGSLTRRLRPVSRWLSDNFSSLERLAENATIGPMFGKPADNQSGYPGQWSFLHTQLIGRASDR